VVHAGRREPGKTLVAGIAITGGRNMAARLGQALVRSAVVAAVAAVVTDHGWRRKLAVILGGRCPACRRLVAIGTLGCRRLVRRRLGLGVHGLVGTTVTG